MWGDLIPSYQVNTENEINTTPDSDRGIYLFFLDSGQTKYPIYVGITRRNFRQRFKEHYDKDGGVIQKYNSGNFPTNRPPIQLPLKVMCMSSPFPMSKLIESIFLAAFNFCLNTDENGDIRTNLDTGDQYSVVTSKPLFDITFDNIMKEIKTFYDKYKQD